MLSRRHFLRNTLIGATALGGATGLYTWRWEPEWLEITRPELPILNLPAELEGATLAHLSDLHIGPRVDSDYIIRTFQQVTALRPDIVVFTGDWVTYRGEEQLKELSRVMVHCPQGRLGTFGILGNHDYGWAWRMPEVGDDITRRVADAGVQMLRDQSALAGGLEVIGLEDWWGPNFAPQRVLNAPSASPARLVLCHNPDVADLPIWNDYRGWILAGHTHGGQCKPPFLPPPILPVKNRRYTAGAIKVNDERTLYISRGVGYMIRVRFNVRPEVGLFTLRRAA